jgi:hypothetical protein
MSARQATVRARASRCKQKVETRGLGRNMGRKRRGDPSITPQKPLICRDNFSQKKRLMGLEPTTSCMASASERSLPFAPVRSNLLFARFPHKRANATEPERTPNLAILATESGAESELGELPCNPLTLLGRAGSVKGIVGFPAQICLPVRTTRPKESRLAVRLWRAALSTSGAQTTNRSGSCGRLPRERWVGCATVSPSCRDSGGSWGRTPP